MRVPLYPRVVSLHSTRENPHSTSKFDHSRDITLRLHACAGNIPHALSPQAPTLLLPNDIEPRLLCPSLCTREIPSFVFILLRIPVPASLYVSHPEQANTLALLYEVSRELTSILDREELLRQVAQRVKKLVNYHVFTVMLWNDKTQHLESAFVMRYGDSIPSRVRVPLHQGLTGAAASARRSVRVSDTLADPRFLACEVDTGVTVRSELVVPLLMQDRLIGVLDLESAETHAFTPEHERMLSTLASYIAIALENARLYEEARESQRLLQEDLSTAREIQRQLLPSGAREVPGLDLAAGYC